MAGASSQQLKRAIPSTGEQVTALGLGTYNVFDAGASLSERSRLKDVLGLFVESGGRVVDSSPMYGSAESLVGGLTEELHARNSLFLATKVWTSGKDEGIRQMENSLRLFRTDTIDLMQVHNLVDWETHLETLGLWKEQGRIRYTGITHYSTSAFRTMEQVMKSRRPDFIQIYYSIITRHAEERILPAASELGIGVVVNRPLETAGLFARVRGKRLPEWAGEIGCATWPQFFLKYVLSHPAVTFVIPATGRPDHLADNMRAGLPPFPDKSMRRKMAEFIENI